MTILENNETIVHSSDEQMHDQGTLGAVLGLVATVLQSCDSF